MGQVAKLQYDNAPSVNSCYHIASELPSRQHTPEMQKLCLPLKDKFKINYIDYARYYSDSIAITTTDDNYALFKLMHRKYKLINSPKSTTKIEWLDLHHPELTSDLHKKFSYLNGLSIIMQHDSFVEHIGLGTSYSNTDIIKVLQQDSELLSSIIFYFRDAAADIMSNIENYKIPLPTHIQQSTDSCPALSNHDEFTLKKFFLIGLNGQTCLTFMEKTCLIETVKLKTSKHIALELGISPKTVEHHLAKLKLKLGITNKSQLYLIAKNNALI